MTDDEVSSEELEKLEEELKRLEDKDTSYGSPKSPEKDSQFKFFRDILRISDTTRVGNLTAQELGLTKLGVRHYQQIALYAEAEGLKTVSEYLIGQAQIISATSMSKKGFWAELFVTMIKREKKDKPKEEKKGWFRKKEAESE